MDKITKVCVVSEYKITEIMVHHSDVGSHIVKVMSTGGEFISAEFDKFVEMDIVTRKEILDFVREMYQ